MQGISVVKEMAANAAEGRAGTRNIGDVDVRRCVYHCCFSFCLHCILCVFCLLQLSLD
jgi:hypothetical protein